VSTDATKLYIQSIIGFVVQVHDLIERTQWIKRSFEVGPVDKLITPRWTPHVVSVQTKVWKVVNPVVERRTVNNDTVWKRYGLVDVFTP